MGFGGGVTEKKTALKGGPSKKNKRVHVKYFRCALRWDTFYYSYYSFPTETNKESFFLLTLYFTVESDRCNCSMNCNTLIMAKRYRVTVHYV